MLQGGTTIFRAGSFEFKTRHLIVIAVLAMAFSTAMVIRIYPIKYGFYLNEFDPYFDYRAVKFILDNGLDAYWKWHDDMSWYPEGRDIAATSQSGLHVTAAIMYQIFGGGAPLMDFTIMFPVVIGSLTVIVVFALVRVLGGTTAGLFAATMFAFSTPIILRGNLGWFKSEPLGLFFALIATYLFISAIRHKEIKYAIPKAVVGGLFLGLANASWGGVQYFSIPIALFFLALPFFRRDTTIPMYVAIAFTVFTLVAAAGFPRPGMSFIAGLPGITMIGSTVFLVAATFLKKWKPAAEMRNTAFLLIAFVVAGLALIVAGAFISPSFRYLNAVNPFIKSQNALVESVAEHLTPTIADYFLDFSVLLIFAGFGAWMAFQKRNDAMVFALILGLSSVYVSATFARLLVFASVGIIVLAGIGLAELTKSIMERKEISAAARKGKKADVAHVSSGSSVKMIYVSVIIAMLLIPIFYPANANWVSAADVPTAIANGGTVFRIQTNDWIDAMNWIDKNTDKNAVFAAWWDYGYWITTLAHRTTIADNATLNQTRIESIAKMYTDDEQSGIKIAHDLKADYLLVYVVGQYQLTGKSNSTQTGSANSTQEVPLFTLGQGGEESKKQWIIRIAGADTSKYLESDSFTPKSAFWSNTLLGKLIPYDHAAYVSLNSDGGIAQPHSSYQPGTVELVSRHVKYPADGPASAPFHLVYSSPSFNKNGGIVTGILIYKVNHDYVPSPKGDPYRPTSGTLADMTPSSQIAEVKTSQGTFKVEFYPKAAPKTVDNFIKLANEKFYDGIVFHRLSPGFVIQGGDPQTKNATADKSQWGTGGPGYKIPDEFNDIPHSRSIVSMAKTNEPDSGGSQFFIVLKDDSQIKAALDGRYAVFGKVIEGMDVVDKIAALQTIGGQGENKEQPAHPDDARIISIRIVPR